MKEPILRTLWVICIAMATSVFAGIAFAEMSKRDEAAALIGQVETRKRQMATAWLEDSGSVYDISTNITSAIKLIRDVSTRRVAVSRYVEFLSSLDLKIQINKTGPVIILRHLFSDAIELLDDSEDSTVIKWESRLKYRHHLKQEKEWLEKAASTNSVVSHDVTLVRLPPSSTTDELKQYLRKRDEMSCSRRMAQNLKNQANFLMDEIQRDEHVYDNGELLCDIERLSSKKREKLLRNICEVLGRYPKGCSPSDKGTVCADADATVSAEIARINAAIDKIPLMMKERKTREVWLSASGLCSSIKAISNVNMRVASIDRFTNTLAGITVDTSLKDTPDRRVIGAQEDELANYWAFAEWGFGLLISEHPGDPSAWDLPIKALKFYKKTILAIEEYEKRGSLANRAAAWHKKNIGIAFDGWLRCFAKHYSSQRHLMSSAQLAEVRCKVKTALGELPSEMAKDEQVAPNK